jgi:hypothetical protein
MDVKGKKQKAKNKTTYNTFYLAPPTLPETELKHSRSRVHRLFA